MAMNMDAALRISAKVDGANSITSLNRSLQAVEGTAKGVTGAFRGMTGAAAGLSGAMGALAPLASIAGLVGLTKGALDAGDKMFDLAQKTGVSVEALARFKKAASTSGTDIDSVSKALVKLSKGMLDASTGNAAASAAFKALGVSITDASGQLKSSDDVMLQVANRFAAMPDGVAKTALALKLFGKAGADMIPLLNMGGQAIDKLSVKMTTAFAQKADEYSDKLTALSGKVGAFGADLLIALLPALNAVTDAVSAAVTAFNAMPAPMKNVAVSAAAVAIAWGPITSVIKGAIGVMALFSTTTTAAGAAATAATPRIVALRSALGGLLKFGAITLAIDVVISGMSKLVELQARLGKVTNRSSNDYFSDIGGEAASREKLQAELANVRKQQVALKKEAASVRFPLLTGQDEAAKAALLVAQVREAKLLAQIPKARPQSQIPSAASGFTPDLTALQAGAGGGGRAGGAGSKSQSPAAQIAIALKSALGITEAQAAGIAGNLMRESGLNPRVNEGGAIGAPRGVGGYGLAQWTGTRQTDLVRFAGGRGQAGDMATQLRFMVSELMGPESKALAQLKTAQSPEQAAYLFDKFYERSGVKAMGERQGNARKVFSEIAGSGPAAGLADFAQGEEAKAKAAVAAREQTAQQLTAARDLLATKEAAFEIANAITPLEKLSLEFDNERTRRMQEYVDKLSGAKSDEERLLLVQSQAFDIRKAEIDAQEKMKAITADQLDLERERATLLADSMARMEEMSTRSSIGTGAQQGIQAYVDSVGNLRDAVGQLTTNAIGGLEESLTSLATTGAGNFKAFAASVLKDVTRMIIRQLVLKSIMQIIGGIGGGGVAQSFEMPNSAFIPSGGYAFAPSALGNVFAANGIQPFAQGGIVSRPTLFPFAKGVGLMGEAGPEAIMPLRRGADGKLGVAGGGGSTTINVSVDAKGSSVQGDNGQGGALARVIAGAVQTELVKQRRPGGLLAS
jgi:lambda family phage tail tape measure protein